MPVSLIDLKLRLDLQFGKTWEIRFHQQDTNLYLLRALRRTVDGGKMNVYNEAFEARRVNNPEYVRQREVLMERRLAA
jgi:hypothetical protein